VIKLSVIIPLAPTAAQLEQLCMQLQHSLPRAQQSANIVMPNSATIITAEIIFAASAKIAGLSVYIKKYLSEHTVQLVNAAPTRASAMNSGAQVATGNYLWFLHADSRFSSNIISQLASSISQYPAALLYFKLQWWPHSPWYMQLNAWGANMRCRLFSLPFGDQGLCIATNNFQRLGGYREYTIGEDHILIWQAKHAGIAIQAIDATLLTSPNKYMQNGWWRTVMFYQYIWITQALGQIYKMWLNK
jgi:hypothetical protein